jgi:hypothetical protein
MDSMGEKGNTIAGGVAAGAGSMIERITTTATETVTGVSGDFLETVKDKSVGAAAETAIASTKDRLTRKPTAVDPDPDQQLDAPDSV